MIETPEQELARLEKVSNGVVADDNGDYVRYSDYAALKAELEGAEKIIRDNWQERYWRAVTDEQADVVNDWLSTRRALDNTDFRMPPA